MIVRPRRFLDLEMPPEFLESWLTPLGHFFVRNHMHEPSTLDADAWRLSIGGEVDKPYVLTLERLSKLESHTVTNTLECAGNGRGFQRPRVPGIQWPSWWASKDGLHPNDTGDEAMANAIDVALSR